MENNFNSGNYNKKYFKSYFFFLSGNKTICKLFVCKYVTYLYVSVFIWGKGECYTHSD